MFGLDFEGKYLHNDQLKDFPNQLDKATRIFHL